MRSSRVVRSGRIVAVVLCAVTLLASGVSAASTTDLLIRMFEERIEQGTWQAGGLAPEKMLQIFADAIGTGDIEVAAAVQNEILRQARTGMVDLEPFLKFLPDLDKVRRDGTPYEHANPASTFRARAAFYRLNRAERKEIYRQTLQSQRKRPSASKTFATQDGVFSENWYTAAGAALEEQMDDLVPIIEQGHAIERRNPDGATMSLDRRINQVLLPLAKARASGDWAAEYLALIRRAADAGEKEEMRVALIREAALELVARNRRDVASQLKEILVTERYATGEQPRGRALNENPIAKPIVGAVRALGDPKFEEQAWRSWHPATPEALDRSLKAFIRASQPSTN